MAKGRLERSVRVTLLGMVTNALLSAGKIVAGVYGHSQALIADGVESLADVISSAVVWRGVVVAAAPADFEHPYGHGKAEPLAAGTVAAILIFAAVWIGISAFRDILRPHDTPASFTLVVLIVVVALKELLFRFALRESSEIESAAIQADAWHHRSDAITSLFAFVGISIALLGGKGYETADDYAAILAAGVIAWNGWRLLRPAMDELMDASPGPRFAARVAEIASAQADVVRIEKCIVRKSGNSYFVDMHVEVAPTMTVAQAHDVSHQVKDAVRHEIPSVSDVLIHIEPAGRGM